MHVAILGAGAIGSRVAKHLLRNDSIERVSIRDFRPAVQAAAVAKLGSRAVVEGRRTGVPDCDLLVLAMSTGSSHVRLGAKAVRRGINVLSVSDSVDDARGLLQLDNQASSNGVAVAVGAGFSPGLTGVLARHAMTHFDHADEIHMAKMGTGGPACARQHHRALKSQSVDWRDGEWVRRPGGSGRELVWFPAPVDAHDCYRGELPDTLLVATNFPEARRVTARVSATRRDRLTMHLPMLRRPHPEGLVGAIRVEVRGQLSNGSRGSIILGSVAAPSVGAAATAATTAQWMLDGRLKAGAYGLAAIEDTPAFLNDLASRGVRAEMFEGAAAG